MPPAQVGVVTVQPAGVTIAAELPGRLEACARPRCGAHHGRRQKRLFDEGSVVRAGQSLFQVDDAPYRAALASAEATQAKADAALAQAQAPPSATARWPTRGPSASRTGSRRRLRQQAAGGSGRGQGGGRPGQAEPRLRGRAGPDHRPHRPCAGHRRRARQPGQATLLATIQQTDKLYVNITQPATEALRLKRAFESGKLQTAEGAKARLVLDDGSEYRCSPSCCSPT
jgi:membrane fusion protein (multidrug efflux system)